MTSITTESRIPNPGPLERVVVGAGVVVDAEAVGDVSVDAGVSADVVVVETDVAVDVLIFGV